MNNIIYILFAFYSCISLCAEISFESDVNYAACFEKKIKYNYCLFSRGDSDVESKTLSTSMKGESANDSKTIVYAGKKFLQRKVEWNSEETANSFNISFHADKSEFKDSVKYDKKYCSYKLMEMQSSSARNYLSAKAAFKVPRNVWAIRIHSNDNNVGSNVKINLFNNKYVANDKTGAVELKSQKFYEFGDDLNNQYFLVNPSTIEFDNYVFMELVLKNNSTREIDFNLNFTIDFIAATDCLTQLESKNLNQIIFSEIQTGKIDQAYTKLACMMTPNYIKHVLSSLNFDTFGSLFGKLNQLEEKITLGAETENGLSNLSVFHALLDRVRFYYSYEILKELYSILTNKVSYRGKSVDSLTYLELLSKRGVLYLSDILESLKDDFNDLKKTRTYVLKIDPLVKTKVDIALNHILKAEMVGFENSHKLVYKPMYLARYQFNGLERIVNDIISSVNTITIQGNDLVFENSNISRLDQLIESVQNLNRLLISYSLQFNSLRTYQDVDDLIEKRLKLLTEAEAIFNINIKTLLLEFDEYFVRHFEEQEFMNIKIGEKTFSNVRDFIDDFESIVEEVRK